MAGELVIASISPVPNTPWPMLYFQLAVSTPCPAGPSNVSDQTWVHRDPMIIAVPGAGRGLALALGLGLGAAAVLFGGLSAAGVAEEQASPAVVMRMPIPAASSRDRRGAPALTDFLLVAALAARSAGRAGRIRRDPGYPSAKS